MTSPEPPAASRGLPGTLVHVLAVALAAAVALALALAYEYYRSPEARLVHVGDPAPALSLPVVGTTIQVRLSDFRGRPVILTTFLSGCRVCEEEVRDIDGIYREMLANGLAVLGIAMDDDPAARASFVKRFGLGFTVLADPGGATVRKLFGAKDPPETYLIDTEGRIEAIWLGSVAWRSKEVRGQIARLLPPRPATAPTTP